MFYSFVTLLQIKFFISFYFIQIIGSIRKASSTPLHLSHVFGAKNTILYPYFKACNLFKFPLIYLPFCLLSFKVTIIVSWNWAWGCWKEILKVSFGEAFCVPELVFCQTVSKKIGRTWKVAVYYSDWGSWTSTLCPMKKG